MQKAVAKVESIGVDGCFFLFEGGDDRKYFTGRPRPSRPSAGDAASDLRDHQRSANYDNYYYDDDNDNARSRPSPLDGVRRIEMDSVRSEPDARLLSAAELARGTRHCVPDGPAKWPHLVHGQRA